MPQPSGEITSILDSVKKTLGIELSDTTFDADLILHINSAFASMHQLGVGPEEPFEIHDNSTEWDEFIDGKTAINSIKSLMYIKVKLLFDPPATTTMFNAVVAKEKELEWRLMVAMEDNYPR